MKQIFILIFAGLCACTLSLSGQNMERLEILNDNAFEQVFSFWNANGKAAKVRKVPGGRSAFCMRMTRGEASKGTGAVFSRCLIPVDREKDTLKMSLYVKGKGFFRLGGYLYDTKGRYTGIVMGELIPVNSKEWVKKDFVFKGSSFRSKKGTFMRVVIDVPRESDLYFDDFSGVKESVLELKPQ